MINRKSQQKELIVILNSITSKHTIHMKNDRNKSPSKIYVFNAVRDESLQLVEKFLRYLTYSLLTTTLCSVGLLWRIVELSKKSWESMREYWVRELIVTNYPYCLVRTHPREQRRKWLPSLELHLHLICGNIWVCHL